MKYILISFLFLALGGCETSVETTSTPVAKVFDKSLFSSEVIEFIPKGLTPDDSLLMAQSYIRNWITKELLLHKAIENLSGQEKDIQRQVEEYRTSLLIHQYKQKLIMQRLEGDVPDEDIEAYYNANKDNFILPTPVVKAVFFILPKSAPNLKDVKKWYLSNKLRDAENLEDYCMTHAKKYDKFDDKWIELKYILNLVPEDVATLEREIQYKKHIEKEDEENYYFLKINDTYKEHSVAPIDYVREEIILILKNKKKLQFESELEKQINEEALRKSYVEIF